MAPGRRKESAERGGLLSKGGGLKAVSRKKRRQQERAAKKQRKVLYNSRKSQNLADEVVKLSPPKAPESSSSQPSKGKGGDLKKKAWVGRANAQERKEISRLEKLLRIDKKKSLPNSFRQDGLDCILPHPHY